MVVAATRAEVVLEEAAEHVPLRLEREPVREHPVEHEVIAVGLERPGDVLGDGVLLLAVLLDVGVFAEPFEYGEGRL